MAMAPEVQSSTFSGSNYTSMPPGPTQSSVGTTGWFKEHALLILLLVISLVAILWYLSRRSSSTGTGVVNPDQGYPLGYPSVGTGASGGAGASSGGSGGGTVDTGAGATASDQAIKDFLAGFALRDGQVNSANTTSTPPAPTPINVTVTPDPIAVNLTYNAPLQPAATTVPPPPYTPPPPAPPPPPPPHSSTPYPVGTVYTAQIGPLGTATSATIGNQRITYPTPTTNNKKKPSAVNFRKPVAS